MPQQDRYDLKSVGYNISAKIRASEIEAECQQVVKLAWFVKPHTQGIQNIRDIQQLDSMLDDTINNMKMLEEKIGSFKYKEMGDIDKLLSHLQKTKDSFIMDCLQYFLRIIFQNEKEAVMGDTVSKSGEGFGERAKNECEPSKNTENGTEIPHTPSNDKSKMISILQESVEAINVFLKSLQKRCIDRIVSDIKGKCQKLEPTFQLSKPNFLQNQKIQEFVGKCLQILSSEVDEQEAERSPNKFIETFQKLKVSIGKAFDDTQKIDDQNKDEPAEDFCQDQKSPKEEMNCDAEIAQDGSAQKEEISTDNNPENYPQDVIPITPLLGCKSSVQFTQIKQCSVQTENGPNKELFQNEKNHKEETACEASIEQDGSAFEESLQRDLQEKLRKKARLKANIGPGGGDMELYGCRLEFPPGAVKEDTEVEISVDNNSENYPPDVIPITPILGCKSSAQFAKEIKIQMKTFMSAADPEEKDLRALIYKKKDSCWECVQTVPLTYKNQIEFYVKNFCKKVAAVKHEDEGKLDYILNNSVYIQKGTALIISIFTWDEGKTRLKEIQENFLDHDCCSILLVPQTVRAKMGSKLTLKMECTEPVNSSVICRSNSSFELTETFMFNEEHSVRFRLRPVPDKEGIIDIDYTIDIVPPGDLPPIEKISLSSVWPVEVKPTPTNAPKINITASTVIQNSDKFEIKTEGTTTNIK